MSCDAAMLRVAALNGLVGERRFSAAWIVPSTMLKNDSQSTG